MAIRAGQLPQYPQPQRYPGSGARSVLGISPGGGGQGGYTGSRPDLSGQGSYGLQRQGGVNLDTGQPIAPTPGMGRAAIGFNPMAAMGRMPQQQPYQPPAPPMNTQRAPAAPSHAGFNGVVAPTPGNGLPGFSNNSGLGIKSSNQVAQPGGWSWSGSGGGGQSYSGPMAAGVQRGDSRAVGLGAGASMGLSPAGGVGGAGGAGGAGGVQGGSGSFGSVGDALTKYYNEANGANEGRYQQLLGMAGQLSDAGLSREKQREQSLLGSVNQQAISSGLGNTTVLPTLQRGVVDDSMRRQQEVADQGLKTQMGIIERRTDQGPDYGLLASLAARAGSGGQSGYGFGAGGLLGGGISPGRHHGASTRGGGGGLSNWPTTPGQGGDGSGGGSNFEPGVYGGGIGGSGMVDGGPSGASSVWDNAGVGQSSFDQEGNPVSIAPGGVRYNQYGEMIDEYGNLV